MTRRIFNVATLISALLLGCTVVVCLGSFWINPCKNYVSLSRGFHISFSDCRAELFSDTLGPYHGSILALTSPERPFERLFSQRRAFGDTLGIYYRYFRWADSGAVLWTLSVSLFYPMIVFAVLPAIWMGKRWRHQVKKLVDCQVIR